MAERPGGAAVPSAPHRRRHRGKLLLRIGRTAPAPAGFVEVRSSSALRAAVAEKRRRPDLADLAHLPGDADPCLRAVSVRRCAHVLAGAELGDLEGTNSCAPFCAGGSRGLAAGGATAPPPGQTGRVSTAWESTPRRSWQVRSTWPRGPAVSPPHFARMFRRAAGPALHAHVNAMRMDRARDLLLRGAEVGPAAAAAVGYTPGHGFRDTFRRQFGIGPGAVAERDAP